jgi:threonine aldolase
MEYLTRHGIKISQMGEGKWRIVTHLDYTDEMHESVLKTLSSFETKAVAS